MKTVDFTQHLLSIQTELFRFAFKLTADREEANDLLQETSLKALDNEEKFTPDTNFKGWMYTINKLGGQKGKSPDLQLRSQSAR